MKNKKLIFKICILFFYFFYLLIIKMERPQDYETLTTLDISNKGLTELPSWVSQCHNLKELNCSWN